MGRLRLLFAAAGLVGNGAAAAVAVVAVDVAACVLHSPLGMGEQSDAVVVVVALAFGVGGLEGLAGRGCLRCKHLGPPKLKRKILKNH